MKNHLKRLASPRTWRIDRKKNVFIVRPKPSGHSYDLGMPLGVLIRDFLNFSSSMRETKKILSNKIVLVDGVRRKDHRYLIGLFDVLSLRSLYV